MSGCRYAQFSTFRQLLKTSKQQYEAVPGMMVALEREQPHRVHARADQEGLAIVMVSIIQGMPTSAPGYSVPVGWRADDA